MLLQKNKVILLPLPHFLEPASAIGITLPIAHGDYGRLWAKKSGCLFRQPLYSF
jgi:hypothetical protein